MHTLLAENTIEGAICSLSEVTQGNSHIHSHTHIARLQGLFGSQRLAQGHFDMPTAGVEDLTTDPLITALFSEPWQPLTTWRGTAALHYHQDVLHLFFIFCCFFYYFILFFFFLGGEHLVGVWFWPLATYYSCLDEIEHISQTLYIIAVLKGLWNRLSTKIVV